MAKQDKALLPFGDVVCMERAPGHSAIVHLHGATVLSWKSRGVEQLFLSSTSVFDNKKAIRGGIPVVFPNFGPWPLGPQHGFARIKRWAVGVPPRKDHNGDVIAVLVLEDDEETRAMWDYKFKLVYTLVLTESTFSCNLVVHNTGSKSLGFTTLLHTYFRVADIKSTSVTGLNGLTFNDKLQGGKEEEEKREIITFDKAYDRVYKDAPRHVTVASGPNPSRRIDLTLFNFPDVVVWNPWAETAKGMGDFDDEGYKEMICVEAGKVASPVTLEAGAQYECSQTLQATVETVTTV